MNETELHYDQSVCPFCNIADAFPPPNQTPSASQTSLWQPSRSQSSSPSSKPTSLHSLTSCIPSPGATSSPLKTTPASFVVLASENVVAFLDILPMTRGHLLVSCREHRVKVQDLNAVEGGEIGFWLPLLASTVATVAGTTDYNIVQNNGARAAQVVPHVHFHIIPRPETMPQLQNKSWTMFGRGQREELDDDEGEAIAGEMRRVLRARVLGAKEESKL